MFAVKREPLVWIELKDGIRLAAKLWIPLDEKGRSEQKFPAILGTKTVRRRLKDVLLKININHNHNHNPRTTCK